MKPESFIFFGFLAGPEQLKRAYASDPMPQVSAVKFQSALIEGLTGHGAELSIVSALPVASYPWSKIAFLSKSQFTVGSSQASGVLMPGTNLPVIKLPMRFLTGLYYGMRLLSSGKGQGGIIVYSVHSPFLATALLLKRLFRVPVFVFVPDLPMNMAGRRLTGAYALIKRLDNTLLQKLMSKVNFAFPFAEGIAKSWLPSSVQYLVVEGIAPPMPSRPALQRQAHEGCPRILYTGHFSHILRFATMFAAQPEIDATLIFVGSGPDGAGLQDLAKSDARIVIKPFAVGEALEREFETADFLLNPRDSRWEGSSLSFPSKLHDYMGRKRAILSTRMPAIPAEYFDCFLYVDDDSKESFAASLQAALAQPPSEINARIEAGEKMLKTTKSSNAVTGRILKAMASC